MFGVITAKKFEQKLLAQREEFVQIKEEQELQLKAMNSQLLNQFQQFNTQIFPHYNAVKQELIYQCQQDIYAVVSRLATAAAMVPFYGEYKDGSELKPKDTLNKLISQLDFDQKELAYIYLWTQGEIFAYKEKIEFGLNAGIKRLVLLNPANVVVSISESWPVDVIGYRYYDSMNGFSVDIAVEDMLFVKMPNPNSDNQMQFRGLSPVQVLKQVIARLQSGMDVSVAQLQNGGVPGIAYNKTPGISAEVMGMHQSNFGRYLNNSSNKGAPYLSAGEWGYFQIGSTLADMDLAALADIDFDKICNVYGVSSVLFNNKSASTESNVKEMVKAMYTNAIMPNVRRLESGLNAQVVPDTNSNGVLRADFSDITELQEDMLQKMQAYAAAPTMVPNDVREAQGQKRIKGDELMDKVYIKSGYVLLDDLANPVGDIDNVADDFTTPDPDPNPDEV